MISSAQFLLFCKEHEGEDIHKLALQVKKYPNIDFVKALQQIKGLQIAKTKLPSWYQCPDIIYPIQLSLEQCSSQETALYKQSLCNKQHDMVDLTGGFGIDTSFLSRNFEKATYVEQQTELTELASHNFKALSLDNITTINTEATTFLAEMEPVNFIYIDPARRDTKGQKTVSIEDCTPNLLDIQPLLDYKADKVMIKLSPMLDISLALKSLTNITEVHVVSVNNECKELLFIKDRASKGQEPTLHCVNLSANQAPFTFTKQEEEDINTISYTSVVGAYIYEPNASLMKAGAYKILSQTYNLEKLHPSSHLYTSNILVNDFPGRCFKVIAVSSLNKKDIKKDLSNIQQANVATRNFPLKAEELKKRLRLKDGGAIYIFGTTVADNQKVIVICEKISISSL